MKYFIGWDVGAWNCDKNKNSRDAMAVLKNANRTIEIEGDIFRGNIRAAINEHDKLHKLVNHVCKTKITPDDELTIAIDTPLGFPESVSNLLSGSLVDEEIPDNYSLNPYLFRKTELWLFQKNYAPLSVIKDMIGSQATKGIHLIQKLKMKNTQCGIWSSDKSTAIETYPSPCLNSKQLNQLFLSLNQNISNEDKRDAVYCGLVAYLFSTNLESLIKPVNQPPLTEGWIWIPKDVFE